jgi:beta-galactosidase
MLDRNLSRRSFLSTATIAAVGIHGGLSATGAFAAAPGGYVPPASPRQRLNFNIGWRFLREDVADAEASAFDDSKWTTVSTPHTWDDVTSFRELISHSGGDRGTYKGIGWYRKHFKLPAELSGHKVFLEFEGMRQAGDIYLNGKAVGLYENGVTAYGVDLSGLVRFGETENILAVKVDNSTRYQERATGTAYEWNANDFNPSFGGINRHVWLHVTGKIYQTLPLFYGLETEGVSIHAGQFQIAAKTADITVDAQVKNASGDRAMVGLSVVVVDAARKACVQFDADPVDMVDGEKDVITATGTLKSARFWSPDDPYLYEVFTICTVEGKVVDVQKETTGFRKTEFRGGVGKGGLYLNDQFTYLKGFAQRSSDEWAGLGQAYPDWMHDYTAQMIRGCHGNYVRWMHVAPQKVDADALTRYGIVQVCPAGDKERDTAGRQWDQRVEVMRITMIYYRNNPGILFWEAGNTVVTPEHMQQMVAVRKQYDPYGGRVIGTRGNSDDAANNAITGIAEYFGVMIGQDPKTDEAAASGGTFRAYSNARRDRAPLLETEDFRDEGARRYWDDYSPPYFGFKKGPNDTYEYTSESFALAGIARYWAYYGNRISNTDPLHSKWAGYASIYFSDSDADGRQDSSEVARVSGKVDAVRLPKEIYFAHRVMQNDRPDLYILGHWSYPVEKKVVKTMYVVSNVESVELFVNGKSLGVNKKRESGYVFAFPQVEFAPGSIKAVGSLQGKPVVKEELRTASSAVAIKLTPILGPQGLQADGADVALIDVEVVDAKGQRCPTDDARIDFTCTGSGVWRGGYNSGKIDSTNNLYLNTEDGINRVAVRSAFAPGVIVVTAKREGLKPAEVRIVANAVQGKDGIAMVMPLRLPAPS